MNNYVCSKCGAEAYYDGRCGDGPILTCGCDKEDGYTYYDGRCGDGEIYVTPNKPIPIDNLSRE